MLGTPLLSHSNNWFNALDIDQFSLKSLNKVHLLDMRMMLMSAANTFSSPMLLGGMEWEEQDVYKFIIPSLLSSWWIDSANPQISQFFKYFFAFPDKILLWDFVNVKVSSAETRVLGENAWEGWKHSKYLTNWYYSPTCLTKLLVQVCRNNRYQWFFRQLSWKVFQEVFGDGIYQTKSLAFEEMPGMVKHREHFFHHKFQVFYQTQALLS